MTKHSLTDELTQKVIEIIYDSFGDALKEYYLSKVDIKDDVESVIYNDVSNTAIDILFTVWHNLIKQLRED